MERPQCPPVPVLSLQVCLVPQLQHHIHVSLETLTLITLMYYWRL
jgi:hypothetical protein